jgi:TolA-binding protein
VSGRDPEPLRVVGATELERRLLAAAGGELPDPALRARMTRAIGLAGIAASSAAAAGSAPAATGASLPWPVISASVAALALTGAAIGYAGHRAPPAAQPIMQPAPPRAIAPAPAPAPIAAPQEAAPALAAPAIRRRHSTAAAPATDLRAEIALLDAARAAVADGADARALALLRRYETRYPAGTFRPESTALRIEALARLGQRQEARKLGADFLASHPDSPVAGRVRRALAAAPP